MTAGPIACADCGTVPPDHTGTPPVCLPCKLNRRLARLLDDGTGQIRPALQPLADSRVPLTHDALPTWPRPTVARYLRHRLIAYGILAPVDRHLVDTEAWLHHRLTQLAEHPHERLLRQFALWHQLPRLRAAAARRPLRSTAKPYASQQFTQAQHFLSWLHQHDTDPAALTQTRLDTWYATHRVHQRQLIRGFLLWATHNRHLPHDLTAHQVAFKPGTAITQQRRLDLLRHFVTDDTAPLTTRVMACLLLLYAQPVSRIHRLTTADLTDNGGDLLLRFGGTPVPVPAPFADLLRAAAATAGGGEPAWLFPGALAGQPISYGTATRRLRQLEFPLGEARVATIRQLVLQAPAPVVAEALGFHHTSTTRQVTNAGGNWNRYATRHTSGHVPDAHHQ